MSVKRPCLAGVAMALSVGCTPTSANDVQASGACDPAVPATERERHEGDPVLVTLQTRTHEVIVHSGRDGLHFTVAMGDQVLFERLDETEFEKNFPSLHRHFESAFAGEGVGWAGL